MNQKINPLLITLGDIYKTKYCPLARAIRKELKKYNIKSLRVCYSTEQPKKIISEMAKLDFRINKRLVGSTAFVPSVAGLIIASDIVKNLICLYRLLCKDSR